MIKIYDLGKIQKNSVQTVKFLLNGQPITIPLGWPITCSWHMDDLTIT